MISETISPLGVLLTIEQEKRITDLRVYRVDHTYGYPQAIILTQEVPVEKTKRTEKGSFTEVEKLDLPLRYYNLQYWICKVHDVDTAIRQFERDPDAYLPKRFGFTSYSKLLKSAQEEYRRTFAVKSAERKKNLDMWDSIKSEAEEAVEIPLLE